MRRPGGSLGVIAALAVAGAPGVVVAEHREPSDRDVVATHELDARPRLSILRLGPWLAERDLDRASVVDQRCDATAKIFLVFDGVVLGAGFRGMLDGALREKTQAIQNTATFGGFSFKPTTVKGLTSPRSAPGLSISGRW